VSFIPIALHSAMRWASRARCVPSGEVSLITVVRSEPEVVSDSRAMLAQLLSSQSTADGMHALPELTLTLIFLVHLASRANGGVEYA
jgi:hypothetical protein